MKLGYKILICICASFQFFVFTLDLSGLDGKEESNGGNWIWATPLCLSALVISITIVTILHLRKCKPERRIFVYANQAINLRNWTNIPKSAISSHIHDFSKTYDEEIEKKMKIKRNMRSILLKMMIYVVSVAVILVLLAFFIPKEKSGALLVTFVIAIIVFVQTLIFAFVCFFIFDPPSKIIIDEEKVEAIKKFDELDETIKITDYKIYPKEMYFEVTSDNKKVYCLLTKKGLYVIEYTDKLTKKKKELFEEYKGSQEKMAYMSLFEDTEILCYDIAKKDIDSIMVIVSNLANKPIEKKASLGL